MFLSSSRFPDWMHFMRCNISQGGRSHHFNTRSAAISSSENRLRIGFAGTPPTIVYDGTSFVTTARAPIMAPSPIVTPARMTASKPTHTSLPITISPLLSQALSAQIPCSQSEKDMSTASALYDWRC